MNSAKDVDGLIQSLKTSGIPLSEAAWEAAKACIGWPYIFGDRGEYDTPEKRQAVHSKHPEYSKLISGCQVLNGSTGSCDGCKWYPGGCRVRSFDCRGFTYWILLQIYGWKLMGAGCTSQWNTESNWKAKGEIKDGIPQGVIVCLFYYKKDSSGKRTKTLEHTGLYYNGETIECSNGVQYSKSLNKKWEVWGIPTCVDGAAPDPKPEPTPTEKKPTLRKGNRNQYVKQMQEKLAELGYDLGICGIDGDFGTATEAAVKKFQRDHGLTADGICGKKTWAAMDAAQPGPEPEPQERTWTVTIHGVTEDLAKSLCAAWPGSTMTEE